MLSGTYKMPQKYILLAITVLSAFILRSQSNSLVIFSASGDPFLLSVDHTPVNTIPQSNLKTFDLSLGWHCVDIAMSLGEKKLLLKDSVLFINVPKYSNKEFTYVLTHDVKKLSLQFKSVSELSGPSTPIVPDVPKVTGPVIDNSIYGNLYKAKENKPVFYANYDPETASCKTALAEKDMQYAIALLNKTNDEARKLNYVNEIIRLNCYTSAQLVQLLNLFPAEMERLTLAKAAYPHVSDKASIALLTPLFKYQTIKDNYAAFIKDQETISLQKNRQCLQPMADLTFSELYNKIKNTAYENEKLNVIKKTIIHVCLSSLQTKTLTQLLIHDREKLECLKCCYYSLTDKEAATTLVSELQFEDSKTEFLNFIPKK